MTVWNVEWAISNVPGRCLGTDNIWASPFRAMPSWRPNRPQCAPRNVPVSAARTTRIIRRPHRHRTMAPMFIGNARRPPLSSPTVGTIRTRRIIDGRRQRRVSHHQMRSGPISWGNGNALAWASAPDHRLPPDSSAQWMRPAKCQPDVCLLGSMHTHSVHLFTV